jgi:hypothetical protein
MSMDISIKETWILKKEEEYFFLIRYASYACTCLVMQFNILDRAMHMLTGEVCSNEAKQ